jgi:hypothetical protein
MQPKTSVRQPVIAGARRQHLSKLLRQWRRQPRKRSPLLFWTLLSLALLSDSALLFLAARFLDVGESAPPPAEQRIDASSVVDWAWRERLTSESWLDSWTAAQQALGSSLLAAGLFAAAAAVRFRWPLWRRRLFFVGLLSCLGCLGCSAALLFGHVIGKDAPPIGDGSQAMLWAASAIMAMGLSLILLFRDAFLAFAAALTSSIGYLAANHWPLPFTEVWPALPRGAAGDTCLRIQMLLLLSAYAALALAWSTAVLTLMRILFAAPNSERLRRLATLCLWPVRLGVVLLAASALLDGWRALEQGFAWHDWSAQAMGTLLVLPGCAALVFVQRRGSFSPFYLFIAVVLGFTFLAMMWHAAVCWKAAAWHIDFALVTDARYCMAGLLPLSLAAHAALRYYFGKQRILEV